MRQGRRAGVRPGRKAGVWQGRNAGGPDLLLICKLLLYGQSFPPPGNLTLFELRQHKPNAAAKALSTSSNALYTTLDT